MSHLTRRTAATRARRGAAFLDEKLGRGWRRKIKRRRLDMEMGSFTPGDDASCGCVLAQLDASVIGGYGGDYSEMRRLLGLDQASAIHLGFEAPDEYPILTEAWLEELRRPAPA